MAYLEPYIYFMIASLLASLRIYSGAGQFPYLRSFPVFLFITISVEITGMYMSSKGTSNFLIYNFYSMFACCYYLYIISRMVHAKTLRRVVPYVIAVYAILSTVNILFYQDGEFHTITFALGCLLDVLISIYFFLELFRTPRSVNLISNPNFWICCGVLFWHSCGIPLFGFINFWARNSPLIINNFGPIVTILNIFLYLLYTIAFLCMRTRKYISSPS